MSIRASQDCRVLVMVALKAKHTLGDYLQEIFAGTYPLVCTH